MRKVYVLVVALSVLMVSAIAFAGPWGPWNSGQSYTAEQQKFFDETKSLRKELHDKRFELMELYRTPGTDKARIDSLEKDIAAGRTKIHEKAAELNITPGFGNCKNRADQRNFGNRPDCFREGQAPARECWKNQTHSRRGMGYGRMMY